MTRIPYVYFFFLNDRPTPEISPLPLHAALPLSQLLGPADQWALRLGAGGFRDRGEPGLRVLAGNADLVAGHVRAPTGQQVRSLGVGVVAQRRDRKSTRLNSSHQIISYAVFCLKK